MNRIGKKGDFRAGLTGHFVALALLGGLPASAQYTITTIAGGNPTSVAANSIGIFASAVASVTSPSPALYISAYNSLVYTVDANSVLTVFAGNGTPGYSGDGGAATDAQLATVTAVSADTSGNVYLLDNYVHIRKVDSNGFISTVYTLPGNTSYLAGMTLDGLGSLYLSVLENDGSAGEILQLNAATGSLITQFQEPSAPPGAIANNQFFFLGGSYLETPAPLAVDSAGVLYVVYGSIVQKLAGSEFVTIAGNGTNTYVDGAAATSTGLYNPRGIAVVGSGSAAVVYLVEGQGAGYIRSVSGGIITTIAGNATGIASGDNGPASQAGFSNLGDIASDHSGSLYIADSGSTSVRKIPSATGIIVTVAGGGAGDGGSAIGAPLNDPQGIAVNQSTGTLYIADGLSRIRQVKGGVISTVAGTLTAGFSGNGLATANQLNQPLSVAVDSEGNLFIADFGNCLIRRVVPGAAMTTIAGNGTCTYTGDGPALKTGISPLDVAVDKAGNVYVLDFAGVHVIQGGIIQTVPVFLNQYSLGLAVDAAGDIYLNDTSHKRIVKYSAGALTTVYSGIEFAEALAVDSSNNLYVADTYHNEIFKLSNGVPTLIAGTGTTGFSGDGGPGSDAELDVPAGLAVDSLGNVYISDSGNNRVRIAVESTKSDPGDVLSLLPNSAFVGSPSFQLTVNGTGFVKGDVVLWNGSPIPTSFVSPSLLTASVSTSLLTAAGPSTVSVGSSNVVNFYVLAPTISSLNPSSTPGGNPQFVLTVTGTGFINGVSTVYFNGQALATTFVSSTQLTAVVPANENGFNVPVSVFNLAQSSNELIFTLGPQQYSCIASGGVPPLLRVGGEAELLGDFVVLCQPGDSSNGVVNQDITITPSSFNFTSRILDTATNATEALLLIGEPAPADQVLGTNVFQGQLIGSNMVFPRVPLDTTQSTTLRFVNLRANTLGFALGRLQPQAAGVTVNMGPISVTNAVQILGFVLPTNFQAAEVFSAGNLRSVDVTFNEQFAGAFKPRVAVGGVQDVPGTAYNTESGFVNPALVTGAGLADYGTRLLLQLDGVPEGVNVYAAVTSDDGVSAVLVPADNTGAGGEGSVVDGSSMFGGMYAPVAVAQGTGTAVWEVVTGNPLEIVPLSFHLVLTGVTEAGLGPIILEGSVAPLSPVDTATATDALPRFTADLLTGFINMTLNSGSATATRGTGQQAAAALAANPLVASRTSHASTPGAQFVSVPDGATGSTAPPIQSGSSVTISYNLLNNSPAPTTQVTVSSTVSPQLTVSGCSAPGGSCATVKNSDGTTSVNAVYAGPVQPGEAPSFSYSAKACNPSVNPTCSLNTTGTVTTTVMALNAGQQFVNDSYPDDNTSGNTFQVISSSSAAPQVGIQLASNPSGLLLQIGSGTKVANPTTTISQSASLSFQAISPQAGPNGSEYVFTSWSDGSTSATRSAVPAPLGGGTFTANYVIGYPLNVTAGKGGAVTLTPAGGYYAPNAVVEVAANPAAGYEFSGYTGDVTGITKTLQLVMPAQALNIQANFTDTPQKITFGPIANQALGTPPFNLNATVTSGLTLTFTSGSPAVCTVSVATVTLLKAGACSITASQAGNLVYEPAPSVTQKFTVLKTQTISFLPPDNEPLAAKTAILTATASSGLTVTFASGTKTACTVSGTTVTLRQGGLCTITASQNGNAQYAAASPVTQSFTILLPQTITFDKPGNEALNATIPPLSAHASSGLTVGFASNSLAICTVNAGNVTLLSTGKCVIVASQPGDSVYAPAPSVTQSFTVTAPATP